MKEVALKLMGIGTTWIAISDNKDKIWNCYISFFSDILYLRKLNNQQDMIKVVILALQDHGKYF